MKNTSTFTDPDKTKYSFSRTADFVKNLMGENPQTAQAKGKGLEATMAVFAKSALRRLPPPLNFVLPIVAEKVILTHGLNGVREVLLTGLRWVKKATDEKPKSYV